VRQLEFAPVPISDAAAVELLIDIAKRFYLRGMTQVEIASALDMDPSTVSRHLRRARETGIVRIDIGPPHQLHLDLGRALSDRFDLGRAVVTPTGSDEWDAFASTAAEYFGSLLRSGMRVGVGWGSTVSSIIHHLQPGSVSGLVVTQLAGGLRNSVPAVQAHELVREVADIYPDSSVRYLHAPTIVDSGEIKRAITRDRSIKESLAAATESELALVGIGEVSDSATMFLHSAVSREEREKLAAAGAIGSMNARFYDREGRPVDVLESRTIAITWPQLRAIPTVVAAAAGDHKRDAITGALKSGCVDVLVTDEETARSILDQEAGS
jgi:DNA-binding transcriptional regulator LsrR (DeoR family)